MNENNHFNGNEREFCYCEGDEDDLCSEDSSVQMDYFDVIVGQLEDILIDKHFQKLQRDFLDKYCLEFDDTEENKLSYMEIFEEYVRTIERSIEERLKMSIPNFNMERFQMELVDNKDSLDGEVFEMLYTLSDFMAFKSLMLDYKAEKEGKNEDFASALTVVPLKI
ncbi:hypothetical protein GE061_010387 [Apolygus lucorum]|uniref:ADP-ribosylation factor-like protein 2-binding protein n=1 Tax=Apolygus lucorum TaxID=248454 RepID=A0A6A4IRF8_APOLU|nr:hypothetical protein GE061_010387 [Apolygus lucorum]